MPHLIYLTLIGGLVAGVVGTGVGIVIKLIRQQPWRVVVLAIAGSLIGSWFSLFPLYAIPGIIGGGPYSGVYMLPVLLFVLPVGAIGGAIALPALLANQPNHQQKRIILRAIAGTYAVMTLVMFLTFSWTCSRPNFLPNTCASAGYSKKSR